MTGSDRFTLAVGALNEIKPGELTSAEKIQYANAVANIEIANVARQLPQFLEFLAKSDDQHRTLLAKTASSFSQFNATYELDYQLRHGESVSETTDRSRRLGDAAKQVGKLL
ncbi:hypothetical protein [Mycobacteroides abscessus]|uniref:hypothetical protein n=1 Tax=Mycobacteroides abscessus TaxID=36809 RepID=UPI0009A6013F|nr:hypothetical protein [Mycobacteroides abscessus]SKQ12617.1 Uncharacterised protein [Mycobacteroides abscessus subsp. massiliense]